MILRIAGQAEDKSLGFDELEAKGTVPRGEISTCAGCEHDLPPWWRPLLSGLGRAVITPVVIPEFQS